MAKGPKARVAGKTVCSPCGAGETGYLCRGLKLDPYLSPYAKLKSKWIKDLNTETHTLNLQEDKMGKTLEDIELGKDFLNRTPIV